MRSVPELIDDARGACIAGGARGLELEPGVWGRIRVFRDKREAARMAARICRGEIPDIDPGCFQIVAWRTADGRGVLSGRYLDRAAS